jgi:hypothetical protein
LTSAAANFGMTHWSVSTCNLAEADMALLLMKLKGIRNSVGSAAHRGTASEAGVVKGLMDPTASLEECQALAVKEFDRLTALSADANREKERDAVPGIVEQALAELRPYGVPSHTQLRIEWSHPDLALPFLGFADFYWEDAGIIVDLKSQLRLSSEISTQHARQVALYCGSISDNIDGRVTYASPKKAATYQVENMRDHLQSLVRIAQRVERFLSISPDINELCGLVIPNTSLFYYDPPTRQAAYEIFGI